MTENMKEKIQIALEKARAICLRRGWEEWSKWWDREDPSDALRVSDEAFDRARWCRREASRLYALAPASPEQREYAPIAYENMVGLREEASDARLVGRALWVAYAHPLVRYRGQEVEVEEVLDSIFVSEHAPSGRV